MPRTVLEAENTILNKIDQVPGPGELIFLQQNRSPEKIVNVHVAMFYVFI